MSYFDLPEVQEARADLRDTLDAAWHDARDHGYDDHRRPTLNEAREDDQWHAAWDDDDHSWADMVRGVAVDSTGWGYLPGHAPIYVGLDGA